MQSRKIITLGCSLTHHAGWATTLQKRLDIPLINLSMSSGSNQLQQWRYQELVLRNEITSNDLIVWQITGAERQFLRTKSNAVNAKTLNDTVRVSKNIFDKGDRLDYLSHTAPAEPPQNTDPEQLLENLLFYIISAKMRSPNTFVLYGWKDCIEKRYRPTFEKQLDQNNIKLVEHPIVEWCRKNKLEFKPDGNHPENSAYQQYVDKCLLPTLRNHIV